MKISEIWKYLNDISFYFHLIAYLFLNKLISF